MIAAVAIPNPALPSHMAKRLLVSTAEKLLTRVLPTNSVVINRVRFSKTRRNMPVGSPWVLMSPLNLRLSKAVMAVSEPEKKADSAIVMQMQRMSNQTDPRRGWISASNGGRNDELNKI